MDVETAADLTNESRTILANAKSRGLTHTIIMEAITLDKLWEDIKDFLRLKFTTLISTPIHHTSWKFSSDKMNLLQYTFTASKKEVRRCDFTNNTATIRIFIKGLKNAHGLATCIYEKGPQTLADAISKVERLQATQHLTAMLIPPTTVNALSQEEDHCFQCQEQGHIACHCPNVRCFECDEYCHIVVDCPHKIPP